MRSDAPRICGRGSLAYRLRRTQNHPVGRLQNGRTGSFLFVGGFDSHAPPPKQTVRRNGDKDGCSASHLVERHARSTTGARLLSSNSQIVLALGRTAPDGSAKFEEIISRICCKFAANAAEGGAGRGVHSWPAEVDAAGGGLRKAVEVSGYPRNRVEQARQSAMTSSTLEWPCAYSRTVTPPDTSSARCRWEAFSKYSTRASAAIFSLRR
jgi:hypothetical protein